MKTLNQIQSEMACIQSDLCTGKELKRRAALLMKKKYNFLSVCKMYLSSNPSQDFLEQEKSRLQKKINLINKGYKPDEKLIEAGLRKKERAEHADYNKLMGLQKIKDQVKTLSFLLS